jgi:hypothetical protein
MDFEDYGKWFLDAIQCSNDPCRKFCKEDNDTDDQNTFLCNFNISNCKIENSDYPVRPQAGAIDLSWFDEKEDMKRVLILGMNPGKGYNEDNQLYEIYDDVIANEGLTADHIRKIKHMVEGYDVFRLLKKGGIEKILEKKFGDGTKLAFAYANQILCRTKPEASDIKQRDSIKEVYKECFENRLSKLIERIRPTLIISLGKTWIEYFKECMKPFNSYSGKYITACHPAHRRQPQSLMEIESHLQEVE